MFMTETLPMASERATSLLKSSTSLKLKYDTILPVVRLPLKRRFSGAEGNMIDEIRREQSSTDMLSDEEESGTCSSPVEEDFETTDSDMTDIEELAELQIQVKGKQKLNLVDLPKELQQDILGYIVGDLGSLSDRTTDTGVRNWHHALRHSRSKEHTDLALVMRQWTAPIQERIYRHLRIQGTTDAVWETRQWFFDNPHLQQYVRHVDYWVPVWEKRPQASIPAHARIGRNDLHHTDNMQPISSNYQLSSKSSSIEEMFKLIEEVFGKACVLTIQGGTCKKPPKMLIGRDGFIALPVLPTISTLVLKGAWTILREPADFHTLARALPNLRDWQCKYASMKYLGYTTIHYIMPTITQNLNHLHLCMDGFYRRKLMAPDRADDLRFNHHLCESLGQVMSRLEAITFSGRVCYHLFSSAVQACQRQSTINPRLRTVDLIVRSCCRDLNRCYLDNTGIYDYNFCTAFERLAYAAAVSLKTFTVLSKLRIRYVDLDCQSAWLNPYFQIHDGVAFGIYSKPILAALATAYPPVMFAEEPHRPEGYTFMFMSRRGVGRRPARIHIKEYALISGMSNRYYEATGQ